MLQHGLESDNRRDVVYTIGGAANNTCIRPDGEWIEKRNEFPTAFYIKIQSQILRDYRNIIDNTLSEVCCGWIRLVQLYYSNLILNKRFTRRSLLK